jgi:hypothetical protein
MMEAEDAVKILKHISIKLQGTLQLILKTTFTFLLFALGRSLGCQSAVLPRDAPIKPQKVGTVKKGDAITMKVYYDFTRRPATPMANGKEDGLMGISMTYLGLPMPKDS